LDSNFIFATLNSKLLFLSTISLLTAGCSQFSNNPVSKSWHNTNAKFNSLIIAREGMKYAEKGIARNYADNYSGMIPILLPIDSTLLEKSQKDNFDFAGMMGGGNTQMTENGLRQNLGNGNSASLSSFGGNDSFGNQNSQLGNNASMGGRGGRNNNQNSGQSGMGQGMNALNNLQNGANQVEDIAKKTGFDILAGTPKTQVEEVIKKTSLIAERHSNSKFLDESYYLLGKARLYKGDLLNAIEIFKYINSTGTNPNQKHAALIGLMRAYIEQKDYPSALKVAESLKEEDLNDKNTADYYLTKAYLHQQNGEYAVSVALLDEAVKLMKRSSKKARVHYAAGQMYEKLNRSDLALPHYQSVANNRPDYDLEFFANLNALLASASRRGSGINVNDSFQSMLKDRKNSDLKDKIYFTMGKLEIKKANYPKAIEFLNASVRNASANPTQKAFSYLELAELHYDKLQKYKEASMYFDSTMAELPKNNPEYDRIKKRSESLADFVKYRNTIILEDSLQKLAEMNPLALDQLLEKNIKQQQEDAKKRAEAEEKAAAARKAQAANNAPAGVERRWILYDPIQISQGKVEFSQVWGTRQNEDNWRRKDKEAGTISMKVERGVVGKDDVAAPSLSKEDIEKINAQKDAKELEDKKKAMMAAIPTTPEKLAESKQKVEDAYYYLGKIYKLQFNEPENAFETFQNLLVKYPNSKYEAETLYFLTLLSENQSANPFRQSLMSKYPTSTYARQLLRGNTQITSDTESKAQTVYNQAFKMYENESFDSALILTEEGLVTYTGTTIEDKFAMLRIILLAKTEKKDDYTQGLKDFIQGYPSSNLLAKAVQMLTIVQGK
jgi:tetratricopeptide (TPR) repeat protein